MNNQANEAKQNLWAELQKQFEEHYAEFVYVEKHGEHSSEEMENRYDDQS